MKNLRHFYRIYCLIILFLPFCFVEACDETGEDVSSRVKLIRQYLGTEDIGCNSSTLPIDGSIALSFDGSIALSWVEVPNSSQQSVYDKVADTDLRFAKGALNSWFKIQSAWGGATIARRRLYLWGGGHADGSHNGILSVDPETGKWQRVTEPSPVWQKEDCPNLLCPAETGECTFNGCNTGPDGRPVSRHTYNNLAADDSFLYSSGGSIWRNGKPGESPRNWRFDLDKHTWSTFPESGNERVYGNLIHVKGKLYQVTTKGYAIFNIGRNEWEFPAKMFSKKRRKKISGQNGRKKMVYDDKTDRFYIIGDGVAKWTPREEFGIQWHDLDSPYSATVTKRYPGVTVHNGHVLIWVGGAVITTIHTSTNKWNQIIPAGNPGEALEKGTYGRFASIGGSVILVNGAKRNMYKVIEAEKVKETGTDKAAKYAKREKSRAKITSDKSSVAKGKVRKEIPRKAQLNILPHVVPPAPIDIALHPYFSGPQGSSLVEQSCGPESDWATFDIRTDKDAEKLRKLKPGDRLVVRVHWREKAYLGLRAKKAACLKFVGLAGPDGQKPLVMSVNGTTSSRHGVRQGGLIIENLRISPGDVKRKRNKSMSGDCIGIPNDQQFVILKNIHVSGCPHHAFITSRAYQMYLEVANSSFEQASSHLAYIDHVAYAYIHDSTFQSPGWGHALRCIAATCHIENVHVSNVKLNGSVLPPGGTTEYNDRREYIGMHPLEVFTCGGGHIVKNVKATFLSNKRNGSFAADYRWREAMNTCDLAGHNEKQWLSMKYGEANWYDQDIWDNIPDIDMKVEDMVVECVGAPCHAWSIKSSYPFMNDRQKSPLITWLKTNSFSDWESMVQSMHDPIWKWLSSRVRTRYRKKFMDGKLPNKIPLPVHEFWRERAVVSIKNLRVNNGANEVIRPGKKSDAFCFGKFTSSGECTVPFRQAKVVIQ